MKNKDIQIKRYKLFSKRLKKWTRKAKIARNKLKLYSGKVKRYETILKQNGKHIYLIHEKEVLEAEKAQSKVETLLKNMGY